MTPNPDLRPITSIAELRKLLRLEGIGAMEIAPTEEISKDRLAGKIDGIKFAERLIAEFEASVRGRYEEHKIKHQARRDEGHIDGMLLCFALKEELRRILSGEVSA